MATPKLLTTRIDLAAETRKVMIALLNQQLAEPVEEYVDLIAERVTALGGIALGTVRMSSAASRLPEYPVDVLDSRPTVEALAARYASLAASTRGAITTATDKGDLDTADLFTEISRGLDKSLWFLEAHLQA